MRHRTERHPFHATWLGRIWNFFRCFMHVPFYFWTRCPRCNRWFGGLEDECGGYKGNEMTCWRCPGEVGWFPYGDTSSRYWNGKDWEGEPVERAYYTLNDQGRAP